MKRTIFMLAVALLSAVGATAQTRKEIYKLPKGEAIYENAYVVYQTGDADRFAMITTNEKKGTMSFILNGKTVASWKNIEGAAPNFHYLNLDETDGYIFSYDLGGEEVWEMYLNIKGKTVGPYERVLDVKDNGDYSYMLAGRWYIKMGGKTYGPYIGGTPDKFTPSGKYIYAYYDDDGEVVANVNGRMMGYYTNAYRPKINDNGDFILGYQDSDYKWSVMINDSVWGAYEDINDPCLNENGDYAFQYSEIIESADSDNTDSVATPAVATNDNDDDYNEPVEEVVEVPTQDFIVFNGKTSTPYEAAGMVRLTEGGKLAYAYRENERYYILFDGKIIADYDGGVGNIVIDDNGNYGFSFVNEDDYFVNINGKEFGPFSGTWDIILSDNGNYIFDGRDTNDNYFININGNVVTPKYAAFDFEIDNDGNYSYTYSDMSSKYRNDNGTITHIGDILNVYYGSESSGIVDITSTDGEHSFFSSSEYNYVVIDGERVGKASADMAWWNETKNAFVWIAVEESKLVIYEYKI